MDGTRSTHSADKECKYFNLKTDDERLRYLGLGGSLTWSRALGHELYSSGTGWPAKRVTASLMKILYNEDSSFFIASVLKQLTKRMQLAQ
jgi:hypothetical protein